MKASVIPTKASGQLFRKSPLPSGKVHKTHAYNYKSNHQKITTMTTKQHIARYILPVLFIITGTLLCHAQSVIPVPKEMTTGEGYFDLSSDTRISYNNDGLARTAGLFNDYLNGRFGVTLKKGKNGKNTIRLKTDKNMPTEAYSLTVSDKGVEITGNDAGVFYGIQTLQQLLVEDDGKVRIPHVTVNDEPPLRLPGFTARCRTLFLSGRVRERIHRPDGAVQDKHFPLKIDRGCGVAHRNQEISGTDQNRSMEEQHPMGARPYRPGPSSARRLLRAGTDKGHRTLCGRPARDHHPGNRPSGTHDVRSGHLSGAVLHRRSVPGLRTRGALKRMCYASGTNPLTVSLRTCCRKSSTCFPANTSTSAGTRRPKTMERVSEMPETHQRVWVER